MCDQFWHPWGTLLGTKIGVFCPPGVHLGLLASKTGPGPPLGLNLDHFLITFRQLWHVFLGMPASNKPTTAAGWAKPTGYANPPRCFELALHQHGVPREGLSKMPSLSKAALSKVALILQSPFPRTSLGIVYYYVIDLPWGGTAV